MSYATIEFKIDGGLGVLTIQRPESLNALNGKVLQELDQVFEEVEKSAASKDGVRVLVLQGAGDKSFVAGADIKEIDSLAPSDAYEFAVQGQRVFRRLELLPVPTLAKIQGFALGGGFELALSTDMILASTRARFGLPECSLGLIPGFGGTVRLSRRIGPQRAKQVALLGSVFSAEEAFQLGMVNKVVEPEMLDEEAQKWAQTLLLRAPLALRGIKTSIDRYGHLSVDEALKEEAKIFRDLFSSDDQKEGTRAFIEKRKPVFKGH